jgi:hypothetical protein
VPDDPRDWEQIRAAALDAVNEVLDDTPLAERVTDAILAVFDEEAVNRLAAEFIAETKLKSMDFRNGGSMELEPARDAAALWVGAARGLLDTVNAENYTEIEMTFGIGEDPRRYAFTCQRVGKLTPHQARRQAEAERDAARDVVREMTRYLVPMDEHAMANWMSRAGTEDS